MARSMFEYLDRQGMAGDTVLEVGGGVGDVHIEMLKAGAAHAVSVELSPGYEDSAAELLRHEGLTDRVERRIGDFADDFAAFAPADHVVMNRVLCCYPDMPKLMNAALSRTRGDLAATFPRDRWYNRLGIRAGNWYLRRRRVAFQAFVHSPDDMVAFAAHSGYEVVYTDHNFMWQAVVFRPTEADSAA